MRTALAAVLMALPAMAGEARPKPADYSAQAKAGPVTVAAECMVHTFSEGRHTFVAEDYLVVEVGVYPDRGTSVTVSAQQFALRINGKKALIYSRTPQMVAASLKYPDWENPRGLETAVGVGPVILGRPPAVERFPGDPRARRGPQPPRVGDADPKEPEVRAEDVVISAALTEGETRGPVGGYLYFPYEGKMKKVRRLELLYNGPAGRAELTIVR